jgi:hypothetical protein
MTTDHSVDQTIRNLEGLSARLAQEMHEGATESALTPEQRLRKEALMTTRVLLSKLRLVRSFSQPET